MFVGDGEGHGLAECGVKVSRPFGRHFLVEHLSTGDQLHFHEHTGTFEHCMGREKNAMYSLLIIQWIFRFRLSAAQAAELVCSNGRAFDSVPRGFGFESRWSQLNFL